MKKNLLNKLWLRVGMIVAIMTTALTASAAEEVYSTCLFGTAYNSQAIGSYTATWTASNGGFTWSIVNGNNNNNNWSVIKFGRKNNVSVGAITTSDAYTEAITKVDLTIDALTASNVNSITLYTSADNSTWTSAGTFSKATGTQTVNLASPAKNLYYKIEFDCAAGSANGLVTVSKVEYYYNAGGAIDPSITAADVTIAYDATEGEIEYTVNNSVTGGSLSASTTSDWLSVGTVGESVPFTCEANTSAERTATVTLTYAYGSKSVTKDVTVKQSANPTGPGSQTNPYTVAQARAAIDANDGTQGVYATGIVSAIPTAWSTQYNNITFNFVDAEGDTDFLQAYRCASTPTVDASTVAVGDVVVVYGNLKKYGTTYEFDTACQLVSLTKAAVAVEAPAFTPVAGTYAEAQNVTISCETSGATIYYTTDGTEPTTASSVYSGPIAVSETTTIKAIAVAGTNQSTIASATYHICSADAPYTVAQALAFAEYPANGVYVHGIVSTAPTQTPTSNGELTYYISDDGAATNQLEVYKGKGLEQAAFTAQDDLQVGDIVTVYGNVQVYGSTIEFGTGNYLVSFERPVSTDPVIIAENATIAYDITYYELMYEIQNPVEGTVLAASTEATWITSVTPSTKSFDRVMIECEANEGADARTATIVLTYGTVTKEVTLTQEAYSAPVEDYVTLPYSWEGGPKADLLDETGVTAYGLGSDYAASNAPYRVKFDTTGDYIQFKTNERPGVVTIGVKMLGGADASSIIVQESADGETFADLQTLTISGAQNSILTLKTTTAFAETTKYIRLSFDKGSNVGVGPISIDQYGEIVLDDYILSIANPENVTITVSYDDVVLQNGENEEVTEGTEVSVVVVPNEGYDFESLTIAGEEEGQTVTPTELDGVYTFTMPAFNVTINATVVEHVEVVTADYVLATSITSGKRYVIASGTGDGTVQVMGNQASNNRPAVAATITDGVLSVSEEYEFVIEDATIGEAVGYSIYDEDVPGYLYAASSSANHLKTQATNDNNGIWRITFDAETGAATVIALGENTHEIMRYNSGNTLFSCYTSGQQPVYFFEKVEEAPLVQTVTVSDAGYATMVAVADLAIPADVPVEVFTAKINGSYATLTAVTAGVPAGAAVVVKASAGEYNFPYTTDNVAELTDNDLVGATEDVVADGSQYVLANGTNGVGFYKATPNSTIKAGKAYLLIVGGGNVKNFYGFEDDATAIEMVNGQSSMVNEIYNVAGQRLQKMQKGINIVGGKKIAIK